MEALGQSEMDLDGLVENDPHPPVGRHLKGKHFGQAKGFCVTAVADAPHHPGVGYLAVLVDVVFDIDGTLYLLIQWLFGDILRCLVMNCLRAAGPPL